jgi:hypothetical protein
LSYADSNLKKMMTGHRTQSQTDGLHTASTKATAQPSWLGMNTHARLPSNGCFPFTDLGHLMANLMKLGNLLLWALLNNFGI